MSTVNIVWYVPYIHTHTHTQRQPTLVIGEEVEFTHGRMRAVHWKTAEQEEPQPLMFQTLLPIFLTCGIIQGGGGQSSAAAFKESVPLNLRAPDLCATVKSALRYTERALRKLFTKGESLQSLIPPESEGQTNSSLFIGIHPRYECEAFEVNTSASQFEEKPIKSFKGVQGRYLLVFQLHSVYAATDSSVWRACFALRSISRVM